MRGGMEAIYDDVPVPVGLTHFALQKLARGAMFSARKRAGIAGDAKIAGPVEEE
jgi:hypothetical protein